MAPLIVTSLTAATLITTVNTSPLAIASGAFVDCKGSLGAITIHHINIPQGRTCILKGTTVQGHIVVRNGATLKAVKIKVAGQIRAVSTARVLLDSASIVQGGVIQSD